jgi:lipopolysaccharide export system ATP-binding protein
VRKVLSWLRPKAEGDSKSPGFADAWRLDAGGAPNSLDRPLGQEARQANERRPVQETRPAADGRPPRDARTTRGPRPVPMPEVVPVKPARPPVEQRLIQQLRTIQELRQLHEAANELEAEEPRRASRRAPVPAQPVPAQPAAVQPAPAKKFLPGEGTLAATGLVKVFGSRRVVNDVSIGLKRGEAVGLLGPNGAGKTTAFYMIVGLIKADAGKIMLDGYDVTSLPMYRRARLGIGYLPQEASIFRGLSVEDNIRSVLEAVEPSRRKREEELDRLLDEFNIQRIRKSPAIALSGGERRRVEIARALATRPSFMLLDEPFAGIDPIAVGDIQELVRHLTRRGIGVLITDHNVRETLGLVDRAYIVHSGQILMEGHPDEIVQSEKVRRVYLGEEFRL